MITKLSKIFGKEIFTSSGSKVGRVADVAIDVDTRRISDLFISNIDPKIQKNFDLEDRKGVILSYSGIKNIQDIVIISDLKPRMTASEESSPALEEPASGRPGE